MLYCSFRLIIWFLHAKRDSYKVLGPILLDCRTQSNSIVRLSLIYRTDLVRLCRIPSIVNYSSLQFTFALLSSVSSKTYSIKYKIQYHHSTLFHYFNMSYARLQTCGSNSLVGFSLYCVCVPGNTTRSSSCTFSSLSLQFSGRSQSSTKQRNFTLLTPFSARLSLA